MSLARAAVEINEVLDELRAATASKSRSIFISYAREDVALVEALAAWLEIQGYRPWWDSHIEVGAEFEARIERALDDALVVIAIWSDNSVRSNWVKFEAHQAMKRGKLIPVAADGFDIRDIRPPFNSLNTLPLGDWGRLSEELEKLGGGR